MSNKILTANRLSDGLVVYLKGSNIWTTSLRDAAVARDDATEAKFLETGSAAVSANHVVDPYLVDVADNGEGFHPIRFREAIRAKGPTVETRHASGSPR